MIYAAEVRHWFWVCWWWRCFHDNWNGWTFISTDVEDNRLIIWGSYKSAHTRTHTHTHAHTQTEYAHMLTFICMQLYLHTYIFTSVDHKAILLISLFLKSKLQFLHNTKTILKTYKNKINTNEVYYIIYKNKIK